MQSRRFVFFAQDLPPEPRKTAQNRPKTKVHEPSNVQISISEEANLFCARTNVNAT
jgi:hypothetical protein